jgi:hypothetical protein
MKFEFTGKYGSGLFKEICSYGVVASEISRNEPHNIIHVHDWLTYPACHNSASYFMPGGPSDVTKAK